MKPLTHNPSQSPTGRWFGGGWAVLSTGLMLSACAGPPPHPDSAGHPALAALSMEVVPASASSRFDAEGTTFAKPMFDPAPLTDAQREDIEWLSSILQNPANDSETRTGAAIRLLNMNRPQAIEPLRQALVSGEKSSMLPVIAAMNGRMTLPESLLDAAVEALHTVPDEALEPLAVVLAQHHKQVLPALGELIFDEESSLATRRNAIHALGSFRNRGAAVELIALLDPERDEDETILEAACQALKRATGLPYDFEPERWLEWWQQARDLPDEEWLTNMVQRLAEQLLAKEQEVQKERENAARIERRLAETYRDLFPRHSIEEQLRALPDLLDDPLPTVRGFALDTISRLLRDSVRLPEELQQKVLTHLNDEVPAFRLHAAQIVDQLNVNGTAERLIGRLPEERDPEVVAGLLDLIARRPTPASIPAVLPRLNESAHRERAARVLWTTLRETRPDEAGLNAIYEAVVATEGWQHSPTRARLVSATAPEEDREQLVALLEDDDALVRRATAEGFLFRGITQPIIDRADDSELYPLALTALERQGRGLTTFRTIVRLDPPVDHVERWRDAVVAAAATLEPSDLLDADGQLVSATPADDRLRSRVLARVLEIAPDAIDADVRRRLFVRYAETLLRLADFSRAHEVMQLLNDQPLDGAARELRFETALLERDFDSAATVYSDPGPWLRAARRIGERWPDRVEVILEALAGRFEDRLDEQQREAFDQLRAEHGRGGELADDEPDSALDGADADDDPDRDRVRDDARE